MSSPPSASPKTTPPREDLRPRLWVKAALFLLVCGLLVGGVGRVYNGTAPRTVDFPDEAVIEAAATDAAPEAVAGRLAKVLVNEGDRVKVDTRTGKYLERVS